MKIPFISNFFKDNSNNQNAKILDNLTPDTIADRLEHNNDNKNILQSSSIKFDGSNLNDYKSRENHNIYKIRKPLKEYLETLSKNYLNEAVETKNNTIAKRNQVWNNFLQLSDLSLNNRDFLKLEYIASDASHITRRRSQMHQIISMKMIQNISILAKSIYNHSIHHTSDEILYTFQYNNETNGRNTGTVLLEKFDPRNDIELGVFCDHLGDSGLIELSLPLKGFTNLPVSLAKISTLENINMRSNSFEAIPDVVFTITDLRILNFSGNRISTISPQIGQLVNLEELDLSNNPRITSIPVELYQLKNLKKVRLSGTRISDAEKQKFEQAMRFHHSDFELL